MTNSDVLAEAELTARRLNLQIANAAEHVTVGDRSEGFPLRIELDGACLAEKFANRGQWRSVLSRRCLGKDVANAVAALRAEADARDAAQWRLFSSVGPELRRAWLDSGTLPQ